MIKALNKLGERIEKIEKLHFYKKLDEKSELYQEHSADVFQTLLETENVSPRYRLISYLNEIVTSEHPWVTQAELCEKVSIQHGTASYILKHPGNEIVMKEFPQTAVNDGHVFMKKMYASAKIKTLGVVPE